MGRKPLEISHVVRTAFRHFCTPDLAEGKRWYTKVLGFTPYFDQPFYVGFNVGGFELGLLPDGGRRAQVSRLGVYWGVKDIKRACARLLELGAQPRSDITDVGEGIRVADVLDPWGNVFGIIENPHYKPGESK